MEGLCGSIALVEDLEQEMARRMHLGIQPGLSRMFAVMGALGSPNHKLGRVLLVAGTNGKGSTCAFLESILRNTGRRVAFYSSPHLARFTERIRVDGAEVALTRLQPSLTRVMEWESTQQERLTGFELVTAVAFDYLATLALDYTVVEVGMGGRLDATNVVTPQCSVITAIGLDHMEFLGNTLTEIASEKAGIIRPALPVVIGPQPAEVMERLEKEATDLGAEVHKLGEQFEAGGTPESMTFRNGDAELEGLCLGLRAAYQVENAAVAVQAACLVLGGLGHCQEAVSKGVASAQWPGRFDLRSWQGVPILLDGAHNVPGAWALRNALQQRWPGQKFRLLFSSKAGKQTREVVDLLGPLVDSVVVTSLPRFQGTDPELMASWFPATTSVEVEPELDLAWRKLAQGPARPIRLCCGSLYLVGYCLSHFDLLPIARSEEP